MSDVAILFGVFVELVGSKVDCGKEWLVCER